MTWDTDGPVIAEYPAIGYSTAVVDLTPANRPPTMDGDGNLWGVYRTVVVRDGVVVAGFTSNVDGNAFRLAEDLAAGRRTLDAARSARLAGFED